MPSGVGILQIVTELAEKSYRKFSPLECVNLFIRNTVRLLGML